MEDKQSTYVGVVENPNDKPNSPLEKLDISLFPDSTSKTEYEIQRSKYIAEYENYEHRGGFFSSSLEHVKRPDVGEAQWNKMYPQGYSSWAVHQQKLTAYGEQQVIDKINEIIDRLNHK